MEYNLIRAKRKSITIRITEKAVLEVRAPLKMPKSEIDKLLLLKQSWIEKHVAEMSKRAVQKDNFLLDFGSAVLYRGQEYLVTPVEGNKAYFDNGFFAPKNLQGDAVKYTIRELYKKLAKAVFREKAEFYAEICKVVPIDIKINSAKTRWGSCSGKNSINFSWRLIMAPDGVIDYVIVHEMCHIKEHNHSDRFWKQVEAVFPDYKERQRGLKILQEKLNQESWD